MIREIFLLRAIACLAIVFMHSITVTLLNYEFERTVTSLGDFTRMLLMFGTPMFIFISEFVIAHAYKDKIPPTFLRKRILYILVPYLCMGLLYTWLDTILYYDINIKGFFVEVVYKVAFGNFHGYFILVIFQFYILHLLITKYVVKRYDMKHVIGASVLINVLYLSLFDYVIPVIKPYLNFVLSDFFIGKLNILPFFAWVGYFTIAYYCGSRYEEFKKLIKTSSKVFLVIFALISLSLMEYLTLSSINENISSKRIDVFLYTLSVIGVLFYMATRVTKIPKVLVIISQYSFGIYLLHPFLQKLVVLWFEEVGIVLNPILFISIVLFSSLLGSILITHTLNKMKIGKFIVGKIGKVKQVKYKIIEGTS